jgi:radical SAM protein (TIGR01212 family)
MLPFTSYKHFLCQTYGEALYRVPIDLELGCPNRSADGTGGCTFCPENGARAIQTLDIQGSEEQLQAGVDFARRRYGAQAFMLYIQAYTGTFASVIEQKKKYSQLLQAFPFKAISIGTRPDCLSKATLQYLAELNEEIDVYIELGVQSLHDPTLERINRGHDRQASLQAIRTLKEHGLKVCAHVIIGLPGESRQHYIETAEILAQQPLDGIKIHNLHVIRGTQMAQEYARKAFPVLSEYDYAEELIEFIRRLPPEIPLMRFSTDTPESEVIAPRWTMQKTQFQEYVIRQMNYRQFRQGDLCEKQTVKAAPAPEAVRCKDGSMTLLNSEHKSYYHPKAGADSQARQIFLQAGEVRKRLLQGPTRLLDIGFGMGYNSLHSCEIAAELTAGELEIHALEQDRAVLQQSAALLSDSKSRHLLNWSALLSELHKKQYCSGEHFSISLQHGDARHSLSQLHGVFDLIFLDPFSESSNCELITLEFFQRLKPLLSEGGLLICSNSSKRAKAAMLSAGLTVEKLCTASPMGGLSARISAENAPLSTAEDLPYRDPHGTGTHKHIRRQRQKKLGQ